MRRRAPSFAMPGVLAVAAACLLLAVACEGPQAGAGAGPDYQPTATIKDLMLGVVDESADDVWLAVMAVQTEQGIVETRPQNDEEWHDVRYGALRLAEAANLLMMPGRRVARPGERSETPGVELEPEEMDELIAANRAEWNRHAMALHAAATKALAAIEAQDAERLFEVGEDIELACEGCHSTYWYPNEVIPPLPELIEQ